MTRMDNDAIKFLKHLDDKPDDRPDMSSRDIARTVSAVSSPSRAARSAVALFTKKIFEDPKPQQEKLGAMAPLSVLAYLNDEFDHDWWDWEPETIWSELVDKGIGTERETRDLVMALQLMHNSDYPFEFWHVFENVGHALNFNPVSFEYIQPLDPHEIAYATKVMRQIRPNLDFTDEVDRYIAASARNAGLVYMPVEFFHKDNQVFLDELNNDLALKAKVKKLWDSGVTTSDELPIEIQLTRLSEIREYLADKL